MLLYANGDSHSLGAIKGGGKVKPFAEYVAEKYKLEIYNDAELASSSYRIIRTTKEYFRKNSNDAFVLIGWGTWDREEWSYNDTYYNVMVGWYKHLPKPLRLKYDTWEKQQDYDSLVEKSKIVHNDIYNFHTWLKERNIAHLFFNCMYSFQGIQSKQEQNWDNHYLSPYDAQSSYVVHLQNKNYEHDQWYHFPQEAHAEWANVLIKHIEENDIIH